MPAHRGEVAGYGLPLPPVDAGGTTGPRISRLQQVLGSYRAPAPPVAPPQAGRVLPSRATPPQAGQMYSPTPVQRLAMPAVPPADTLPRITPRRRRVPEIETSAPRDVLGTIAQYARGRRTVVLQYRKATAQGAVVSREIEPYSVRIKGGKRYVYGYCLQHPGIHSFIVANIISAKGTSRRFVPRWTVEF